MVIENINVDHQIATTQDYSTVPFQDDVEPEGENYFFLPFLYKILHVLCKNRLAQSLETFRKVGTPNLNCVIYNMDTYP